MDELKSELKCRGCSSPDLIVLSVGGGGLFCGVVEVSSCLGYQWVLVFEGRIRYICIFWAKWVEVVKSYLIG